MTVFKIEHEYCTFYQDRFNCARCYVSNHDKYLKCKQKTFERDYCIEFFDLMKSIDPWPWDYTELEAKKEHWMNCSGKFSAFAAISYEAYNFLWLAEKEVKMKAASIIEERLKEGDTPCTAIVFTYKKLKHLLH